MKLGRYLIAFYFLIKLTGSFGPPIIEIIGPFKTQVDCQKWATSEELKRLVITASGETCYEGSQDD